jgi:hypothetical protein
MIRFLLVVPPEGSDLLAEGPCGARPPLAQWCAGLGEWLPLDDKNRLGWMRSSEGARALVLTWEGEFVRAGWHTLEDAYRRMEEDTLTVPVYDIHTPEERYLALAHEAVRVLGGRVEVIR